MQYKKFKNFIIFNTILPSHFLVTSAKLTSFEPQWISILLKNMFPHNRNWCAKHHFVAFCFKILPTEIFLASLCDSYVHFKTWNVLLMYWKWWNLQFSMIPELFDRELWWIQANLSLSRHQVMLTWWPTRFRAWFASNILDQAMFNFYLDVPGHIPN